jgi:hypothetical protein
MIRACITASDEIFKTLADPVSGRFITSTIIVVAPGPRSPSARLRACGIFSSQARENGDGEGAVSSGAIQREPYMGPGLGALGPERHH